MRALSRTLVVALLGLVLVGSLTPTAVVTAYAAPAESRADDPPPPKIPGPGDDFARLPEKCYEQGTDRYLVYSPCRTTTFAGRPWVVAWGDSHLLQVYPALQKLALERRVNLVVLHAPGCPVSKTFPASSGEGRIYCDGFNERSLSFVRSLDRRVGRMHLVITSHYAGYRANYARLRRAEAAGRPSGLSEYVEHMAKLAVERTLPIARDIARLRRPVTFIAQAPTVPADARPCAAGEDPYQCDLPRHRALPDEAANRAFVRRQFLDNIPRSRMVTPSKLYCDRQYCRAHLKGGVDTYWDHYHVGALAARRSAPWFRSLFVDVTRR
jgi:hypothetical protein